MTKSSSEESFETAELTSSKKYALDWIDNNYKRLSKYHSELWHFAEPAWREYKSAEYLTKILEAEGFTVEKGSAGMPTAFKDTFSNGDGPVIGGYAEYDAVPGNNQAAATTQKTR